MAEYRRGGPVDLSHLPADLEAQCGSCGHAVLGPVLIDGRGVLIERRPILLADLDGRPRIVLPIHECHRAEVERRSVSRDRPGKEI